MTIDSDLARNFGFDITMSEGSMGLPSAVHKEYMERCQFLYKEFITNMGVHMKAEKVLRKELKALHKEKIQHLRFSLYRSANDPFARHDNQSASTLPMDSRTHTPWDLNNGPSDDPVFRPHTAPSGNNRQLDIIAERPKTAGVETHHVIYDDDDEKSESCLSDISNVSKSTVVGVIDRKTEQSSSRKITVGKATFNKITHGKVRAKMKHRDGRYIVQPVKTDFKTEIPNQDTHAFDPSLSKQKFDPLHERLALVRKITDFKSPTISSDMKINNRVPIQKSLKGINAKRTTVLEIYEHARDRKTRHFRIVTSMPRSKSAMDGKLTKQTSVGARSKSALHDRDVNHSLSNVYARSREGPPLFMRQRISSQKDEIDSVASANQSRPRSILHSNSSATKSLNESFNAKSSADNSAVVSRPQSKVAFARSDSQASGNLLLQPNTDGLDMSASFSSSTASGKQFRDRLNAFVNNGNRHRSVSVNSDATAASFQTENHLPIDGRSSSILENSQRGRHGLSVAELKSRGLARAESKQSLSSSGTVTSFMAKLKLATEKNRQNQGSGPVQKLGFHAPAKMESRKDTVDIVRQQIRQDKQLDERMTVWRRRMAIKSSLMSHRSFSGKLK